MPDHLKPADERDINYLYINQIKLNSRLVEMFSADILRRNHVLPLAEENGCFTVAMADPNDDIARSVIRSNLGNTTCLVKADPQLIDRLIDECFSYKPDQIIKVLALMPEDSTAPDFHSYIQVITDLLKGELIFLEAPENLRCIRRKLIEKVSEINCNLVCLQPPKGTIFKEHLSDSIINELVTKGSVSVLLVNEHRWPIKRILLVIRNKGTDNTAIEWVLHLAARSSAEVTILPLLPPMPVVYGEHLGGLHSIQALLNSQSPLGRRLRDLDNRLAAREIEGTIKMCRESSDWQVQLEALEGDYDLIVMPGGSSRNNRYLIQGELIDPTMRWLNRPVLIA